MNPLVASVSPAGVPVLRPELVQSYRQAGWWQGESISEAVRRLGLSRPDQRAYTAAGSHATWSSYDCFADRIATALQALGLPDEARKSAAVLGANYPGTDWYKRAYELMQEKAPKAAQTASVSTSQ